MRKIFSLAMLFALALTAGDAVPPVYQDDGAAIKGFDPVAYFTIGQPTKGDPKFSYKWMGATWHFANQQHLDLFKTNPEKYAPQYGGYCSYAVSINKTASISPKAWKIVDGKLYLNHAWAQGKWEKQIPENIQKADKNWPGIAKKPVQ